MMSCKSLAAFRTGPLMVTWSSPNLTESSTMPWSLGPWLIQILGKHRVPRILGHRTWRRSSREQSKDIGQGQTLRSNPQKRSKSRKNKWVENSMKDTPNRRSLFVTFQDELDRGQKTRTHELERGEQAFRLFT